MKKQDEPLLTRLLRRAGITMDFGYGASTTNRRDKRDDRDAIHKAELKRISKAEKLIRQM